MLKKSVITVLYVITFFTTTVSQTKNYKFYFNNELLTDYELSIGNIIPVNKGWCNYSEIKDLDIPHRNLYQIWDTLRVNPYGFDLYNTKDSFILNMESNFSLPVKGTIKNDFGFAGEHYNYGTDFECYANDSVLNPFEGVVRVIQASRKFGIVVVIRNRNGTETVLSNLASVKIKRNQKIKAGQVIGYLKYPENNFFIKSIRKIASKPLPPKSFLHFEIRFLGQPLVPDQILDFEKGIVRETPTIINKDRFSYLNEIKSYIYTKEVERSKRKARFR